MTGGGVHPTWSRGLPSAGGQRLQDQLRGAGINAGIDLLRPRSFDKPRQTTDRCTRHALLGNDQSLPKTHAHETVQFSFRDQQ